MGFLCSLGFAQPPRAAIGLSTQKHPSLIWKDSGSGANMDFSVYRPINMPFDYRSLGDVPVRAHSYRRIGFIGKEIRSDAFEDPRYFYPIWDDRGSGAYWDVTFYRPICPSGYVALGDVAVRSHDAFPNQSDAVCVKRDYVVVGNWKFIWNDRGSGADRDVSVYQAVSRDSQGVEVLAMSSVAHHGDMDIPAYVLKAEFVS